MVMAGFLSTSAPSGYPRGCSGGKGVVKGVVARVGEELGVCGNCSDGKKRRRKESDRTRRGGGALGCAGIDLLDWVCLDLIWCKAAGNNNLMQAVQVGRRRGTGTVWAVLEATAFRVC